MNRQEVVISVERMNRFSKQLTYWVEFGSDLYLPAFDQELSAFGKRAKEIRTYLAQNPVPSIIDRILSIANQDMLKQFIVTKGEHLPNEISSSLNQFIVEMDGMSAELKTTKKESKGDYHNLVDRLAYKEAADLLQRSVNAGLLTDDYQPMGNTTNAQLKVIAYAVGTCLKLKTREKWPHFEKLWSRENVKLAGVSLPIRNRDKFSFIMELYPEVDFGKLLDPIPHFRFACPYNISRVKKLYQNLLDGRYIESTTTLEQFIGIFEKQKYSSSVNWIREQRQLAYFIYLAFSPSNGNLWKRTESTFLVNRELPHKGCLNNGYSVIFRKGILKTYNKELYDIAARYNH